MVGADNALLQVFLTLYFVEEKRYQVGKNELNQNNINSTKQEKGKVTSSKGTEQIRISISSLVINWRQAKCL